MTSTSILVIDDSATLREELGQTLAAAGYRVVTAATGEEGLRIAASERPSAIIVDGALPGIDGSTVIRRIRLDAPLRRVPCLLLTGSENPDTELGALDAGADAFVRKGEDLQVILAKLAAMLRSAGGPQHAESTASSFGPRKILAIDDSETYLQALAEELRNEGYDVVLARSGEQAIDYLTAQAVDCILLDLVMPGLSGQETCRRIKAIPEMRDTPLVMLTGLDDRDAMIQGLGAGADDYISKSSAMEILKARVHAQIRRKQFEDENRQIRDELLRKELQTSEARAAQALAETRAALVDELERKNKELEAFSYAVSHDLRAPLRSIDGFSQIILEDSAERLGPEVTESLQRIRKAANRMSELIDDLLQLSRIGRADLVRRRTDLSGLARSIVEELRSKDPARRIEVIIEDGIFVQGDGRLLKVALENLIGNAWKFLAGAVQPRIEFGQKRQQNNPVFFIRDNGAGFDMALADKLFKPFQRLHSEAEFPGTGIGLATVYRVIDRHGGRIWAEAEKGHGAAFHFTLPAMSAAAAVPAPHRDSIQPELAPSAEMTRGQRLGAS
jgi:DNA-binding response OmpR family regulator